MRDLLHHRVYYLACVREGQAFDIQSRCLSDIADDAVKKKGGLTYGRCHALSFRMLGEFKSKQDFQVATDWCRLAMGTPMRPESLRTVS